MLVLILENPFFNHSFLSLLAAFRIRDFHNHTFFFFISESNIDQTDLSGHAVLRYSSDDA
jgi:hypothetical protein